MSAVAAMRSGVFSDERGIQICVDVQDEVHIALAEFLEMDRIESVAARRFQNIVMSLENYTPIRFESYQKKMNLSDDPAVWSAWEFIVKTTTFVYFCIVLRRNLIPPLADTFQDIFLEFKVPNQVTAEGETTEDDVRKELYLAADSFSMENSNLFWFQDIIQAQMDLFLFSFEYSKWIKWRLKIKHSLYKKVKTFLKSLLFAIRDVDPIFHDLFEECDQNIEPDDDPLRVLREIVAQCPDKSAVLPEMIKKQSVWEYCVARYLTCCIDDGDFGARLNLLKISDAASKLIPPMQKAIQQILIFLIHMRPRDITLAWAPQFLQEVMTSPLQNSKKYFFNDRAFFGLLRSNFLKSLCSGNQEVSYIKVLAMLMSSPTSIYLKISISKKIMLHLTDLEDPESYYSIVSFIIDALKDTILRTPDSQFIRVFIISLVNLSSSNNAVKNMLMNKGAAFICVNLLNGASESLLSIVLSLIVNLTKDAEHRQKFLAVGIVPKLLSYTMSYASNFQPHYYDSISTICAILGQFANDKLTRDELCSRYLTVDCALFFFHMLPPNSFWRTKVIFLLKQLSNFGWIIQQRVGMHCIQSLLLDLENAQDNEYIVNAFALLKVIANFGHNCTIMLQLGIEACIGKVSQLTSVASIHDRASSLLRLIFKQNQIQLLTEQ